MSGGGGGGLSKLGTALAIVFAVSLAVLFAELFYVLWRRRVLRRHSDAGGDETSAYSSSESSFLSVAASKELLYFLCVRSQSRLDRSSITCDDTATNDLNSDVEVIDIDLLTIQGMFGPPRFLFTIKEEEEREDIESSGDRKSVCVSGEKELKKMMKDGDVSRLSLEECFKVAVENGDGGDGDQSVVAVEIEVDNDDATPFSTPCASPVFFTPSSSPVNEVVVSFPSPVNITAPEIVITDAAV